jgi:hypothetical protein
MNERMRFEKWAKRMGYADEFDVPLMEHAAWEGWQAALSTRKTYGYGIVDKDGRPEIYSTQERAGAEIDVEGWNMSTHPMLTPCAPYRLVTLFYEDSES